MKLLAIDTSANACSVALMVDDEIFSRHEIAPLQQADLILPMIDAVLDSAKITLREMDAFAFGCGPGSFTGVRIAASVMQGFAFATKLPLIRVSSLAAVAQSAFQDLGYKKMVVAMDARIQEVYWATYEINELGLTVLVGDEIICPPEKLTVASENNWCAVGNAWQVYADKLPTTYLSKDDTRLPMAEGILHLAKDKHLKGEWISLHEALPVYLRDNVAVKEKNR